MLKHSVLILYSWYELESMNLKIVSFFIFLSLSLPVTAAFEAIESDKNIAPISEENIYSKENLADNFERLLSFIIRRKELPNMDHLIVTYSVRYGLERLVSMRGAPVLPVRDMAFALSYANMGWLYSAYSSTTGMVSLVFSTFCFFSSIVTETGSSFVGSTIRNMYSSTEKRKGVMKFFKNSWKKIRAGANKAHVDVKITSPLILLGFFAQYLKPSMTTGVVFGTAVSSKVALDAVVGNAVAFNYYLNEFSDPHYNFRNDWLAYSGSFLYSYTDSRSEEYLNGYLDETLFYDLLIGLIRNNAVLYDNMSYAPNGAVTRVEKLLQYYDQPEKVISSFHPYESTYLVMNPDVMSSLPIGRHCAQFRFNRVTAGEEAGVKTVFYFDACKTNEPSQDEDVFDLVYRIPSSSAKSTILTSPSDELVNVIGQLGDVLGIDDVQMLVWGEM